MTSLAAEQTTITRTDRGLSIAGTRLTIYALLDYMTAGWPPKLIQDWFNLTEQQMQDIQTYVADHYEEVMQEYADVLQQAEQHQQYWHEKNQQRIKYRQPTSVSPHLAQARAKLQAWKAELASQ